MQRGLAIVTALALVVLFAALLQPAIRRKASRPPARRLSIEPGQYIDLCDPVWDAIFSERDRSTVSVRCNQDDCYDFFLRPKDGGRRWESWFDLGPADLEARLSAVPDKAQCWVHTRLGDWGDSDRVRDLTDFLRRSGWRVVVIERPSGYSLHIIAIHYFDD